MRIMNYACDYFNALRKIYRKINTKQIISWMRKLSILLMIDRALNMRLSTTMT